jgi:hypothetical protein
VLLNYEDFLEDSVYVQYKINYALFYLNISSNRARILCHILVNTFTSYNTSIRLNAQPEIRRMGRNLLSKGGKEEDRTGHSPPPSAYAETGSGSISMLSYDSTLS